MGAVAAERIPTITRERSTGSIQVAPGRRLSFASFGPASGPTVIWMHGTPGAATQVPEDARARAERDGFRIIGIDRPGVGRSTAHLYENVDAFTGDLSVVLDKLDVDDCVIIGLSGGGPYTLAAAAHLGDRVNEVAVLGGVAPSVGPNAAPGGAIALARHVRPLLRVGRIPMGFGLSRVIRAATPVGDQAIRLYARFSPDGDRELLNRPEFKEVFVGDLTRRGRRQFSAMLADVVLFSQDWGFELSEVHRPVHWWHGSEDNIVPIAHGEFMVDHLADADFRLVTGGGHLAGFGVTGEVLDTLLGT